MIEGYPKTKYPKRGGGSVMVTSPEQEKNLGPEWQDFPPLAEETPKHKKDKSSPLPTITSAAPSA